MMFALSSLISTRPDFASLTPFAISFSASTVLFFGFGLYRFSFSHEGGLFKGKSKSDLEDISSNVKITNITSGDRLESDLIFIEAAQFEDRPLEITIEKKEEPIIESNILRNLIIGFLGLLIINESL